MISAPKIDVTLTVAEGAAAKTIAVEFAAKLQGMFSDGIRDVINELVPLIRPLYFGPFESAKSFEKPAETLDLEPRQPP